MGEFVCVCGVCHDVDDNNNTHSYYYAYYSHYYYRWCLFILGVICTAIGQIGVGT